MSHLSLPDWTPEGLCAFLFPSSTLRSWPIQVHSLEPQSGVVASLSLVSFGRSTKWLAVLFVQVVCPRSHSWEAKQNKQSETGMTGFAGQLCVAGACDFSTKTDGRGLFLIQTSSSVRLTGFIGSRRGAKPAPTLTSSFLDLLGKMCPVH